LAVSDATATLSAESFDALSILSALSLPFASTTSATLAPASTIFEIVSFYLSSLTLAISSTFSAAYLIFVIFSSLALSTASAVFFAFASILSPKASICFCFSSAFASPSAYYCLTLFDSSAIDFFSTSAASLTAFLISSVGIEATGGLAVLTTSSPLTFTLTLTSIPFYSEFL